MSRIAGVHSNGWGGKREGAGRPAGSGGVRIRCDEIMHDLIKRRKVKHPIEGLLKIASDNRYDVEIRMRAAGILLPYCSPKLSSVEVTGHVESTVNTFVVNLTGVAPPEAPELSTGENGEAVIDIEPEPEPDIAELEKQLLE